MRGSLKRDAPLLHPRAAARHRAIERTNADTDHSPSFSPSWPSRSCAVDRVSFTHSRYGDLIALEALAATGEDVHKRVVEDKVLAAVVPGSAEQKVEKKQAWNAHRRGSMHIAEQPRHWRAQPHGSPFAPERRRFFKVCSELPIGLRETYDHWSPKMGYVVEPGDIVRAVRIEIKVSFILYE